MDIPARVTELRQKKGVTVTELARRAGVSQPYLRQIELGIKRNPSAAVLQRLAKALGVTVADIMGTPVGVPERTLADAPASLQEFVRRRGKALGLRQEDVEILAGIHYRGRQPETIDDWEVIFRFLRRILE